MTIRQRHQCSRVVGVAGMWLSLATQWDRETMRDEQHWWGPVNWVVHISVTEWVCVCFKLSSTKNVSMQFISSTSKISAREHPLFKNDCWPETLGTKIVNYILSNHIPKKKVSKNNLIARSNSNVPVMTIKLSLWSICFLCSVRFLCNFRFLSSFRFLCSFRCSVSCSLFCHSKQWWYIGHTTTSTCWRWGYVRGDLRHIFKLLWSSWCIHLCLKDRNLHTVTMWIRIPGNAIVLYALKSFPFRKLDLSFLLF